MYKRTVTVRYLNTCNILITFDYFCFWVFYIFDDVIFMIGDNVSLSSVIDNK